LKKIQILIYSLLFLSIIGCAKRGSITGGLKDTIPPVLKMSFPKNFTTEFSGKSIVLTFDEYIKLKNVNKQLIISPPLSKNPQILPLTASKSITINFLDSLRTNTTYSLNFGQSIEDNNEVPNDEVEEGEELLLEKEVTESYANNGNNEVSISKPAPKKSNNQFEIKSVVKDNSIFSKLDANNNRVLTYYGLMLAGAVARSAAATAVHPLNVIKTMLQTKGGKMPEFRWSVLSRGAGSQFIMSIPHGAINFAVTEVDMLLMTILAILIYKYCHSTC